ncbi:MAG: hypothetical protein ACFE95_09755 [Candidatus Hodarchaeota archaeon]
MEAKSLLIILFINTIFYIALSFCITDEIEKLEEKIKEFIEKNRKEQEE